MPLTDPDKIYPGQHLRLRADHEARSEPIQHTIPTPSDQQRSSAEARALHGEELHRATHIERPKEDDALPSWVLPGFTGGGTLLAGAAWIVLGQRRRERRRHRRPGFTVATPTTGSMLVERSLATARGRSGMTVTAIDEALRRAAAAYYTEVLAYLAVETLLAAVPESESGATSLVAVLDAEGRGGDARRLLRERLLDGSGDESGPADVAARSQVLSDRHVDQRRGA